MRKLFEGKQIGSYRLLLHIGRGGNGEVWSCTNGTEIYAAKFLKNIKPKPFQRFVDETAVLELLGSFEGIIPIIDKNLLKSNDDVPYFIMPLANSAIENLKDKSLEFIVKEIKDLAITLGKLHARKIFHRDIKPPNILYLDNKISFSDFGLVDYPSKKDISHKKEEIGAKWTMAPEMRRNSSEADLGRADIYSLAKTFWILLMDESKGFDGQYSVNSIISLRNKYSSYYTTNLDKLLQLSTSHDPSKRPSVDEFVSTLDEWQKLNERFHERNVAQWLEIQTLLFPTSLPNRAIWSNLNDIIKVLKIACTYDNLNHMFMPRSGGMDLLDARLSVEEGCIELDFGYIVLIKPKRLLFESFGFRYEWNYFRLELEEQKDCGIYTATNENIPYCKENNYEVVSELVPGNYYTQDILYNKDEFQDKYFITESARLVRRMFRGVYVIFNKRSPYNLDNSTYDARHNKMNTDEFRNYIQNSLDKHRVEKVDQLDRKIDKNRVDQRRVELTEQDIYRCGWCGNLVGENGDKLTEYDWEFARRLHRIYGESIVYRRHGYCCKEEWSSQ